MNEILILKPQKQQQQLTFKLTKKKHRQKKN